MSFFSVTALRFSELDRFPILGKMGVVLIGVSTFFLMIFLFGGSSFHPYFIKTMLILATIASAVNVACFIFLAKPKGGLKVFQQFTVLLLEIFLFIYLFLFLFPGAGPSFLLKVVILAHIVVLATFFLVILFSWQQEKLQMVSWALTRQILLPLMLLSLGFLFFLQILKLWNFVPTYLSHPIVYTICSLLFIASFNFFYSLRNISLRPKSILEKISILAIVSTFAMLIMGLLLFTMPLSLPSVFEKYFKIFGVLLILSVGLTFLGLLLYPKLEKIWQKIQRAVALLSVLIFAPLIFFLFKGFNAFGGAIFRAGNAPFSGIFGFLVLIFLLMFCFGGLVFLLTLCQVNDVGKTHQDSLE